MELVCWALGNPSDWENRNKKVWNIHSKVNLPILVGIRQLKLCSVYSDDNNPLKYSPFSRGSITTGAWLPWPRLFKPQRTLQWCARGVSLVGAAESPQSVPQQALWALGSLLVQAQEPRLKLALPLTHKHRYKDIIPLGVQKWKKQSW